MGALVGISGLVDYSIYHNVNYIDNSVTINNMESDVSLDSAYINLSENELLKKAELAYLSQDYDETIGIYKYQALKDNVIAITNLGYMYANGIGVEKNALVAMEYYDKGMELGYARSYDFKLALLLRNRSSVAAYGVLKPAYEHRISSITIFMGSLMGCDTNDFNTCLQSFGQYIDDYSIDEKCQFFEDRYKQKELGYIKLDYVPTSDDEYTYQYIRTSNQDGKMYRIYKMYGYTCENIDLLQEGFIVMDE